MKTFVFTYEFLINCLSNTHPISLSHTHRHKHWLCSNWITTTRMCVFVCLRVCVWHIQHSNCVSLVGQWGIEVLNPILNLYLSYRGGGDVLWVPTICHRPQFRGIEYGWETTQGPGVATGSRFRRGALICYQTGSGAVDTSTAKLTKISLNEDKTDSVALTP